MRKEFLRQPSPFRLIKRLVEADNAPTAFQAVARHFEFVHRVHILNEHLDRRAVRCFCCPQIEILMSPRLEVECVVAIVEISEFREEV